MIVPKPFDKFRDNPRPPLLGFATLMRKSLAGESLAAISSALIERAARDPGDASAMLDLATVLQLTFQSELGLAAQAHALEVQQLYHLGQPAGYAGIRLLAIAAPGDFMANIPLDCLLEGSDVSLDVLYVSPSLALPGSLPDHDVVIVTIGEPDRNAATLRQVATLLERTSRPVLNRPERSLLLGRDSTCALLAGAPGISMPLTARADPAALHRVASEAADVGSVLPGGAFPMIVRPVGSHAGRALAKVDDPAGLAAYLGESIASEYYVSRFVDYRGADGFFRKYRIVLVDGVPYACHMGVSEHWMIHYLNAGMAESAGKRAEEARFMATFEADFATRHRHAFAEINRRMGLDYIGIDCAELPTGELLIFEVDTGMIVHGMDPVDIYPYKQPTMNKVFRAFRELLAKATETFRADHPPEQSTTRRVDGWRPAMPEIGHPSLVPTIDATPPIG